MSDPLRVLGISRGASIDDAKAAFRTLSLKYHPDKNPDSSAPQELQKVFDAYDYIVKHPEALKIPIVSGYTLPSYGEPITVSLEAVYLHEKQSITIERVTLCTFCRGTGTDIGKAGVCDTCDGTGKIKGTIARLMDLDPTCPACRGTGYVGPACSQCSGNKYVKQRHTVEFFVEPKNCLDGVLVLRGVGDVTQNGVYKDLIVPIRYEAKAFLELDTDGIFCVRECATPVERILSVVKTVKIFGRELRYRVPTSGNEVVIRDLVGKIAREIRVHIMILEPKLTEETKKLYKQILKIEQDS